MLVLGGTKAEAWGQRVVKKGKESSNMKHGKMLTAIAAIAAAGLVACGGGDAEPAAEAAPAEEPTAAAEAAAAVDVSPEALATVATEYSPDVNVDLSLMTQLESGLYIEDILPGEGDEAAAGDRLQMHYTGWLPDGTMFDSSLDGDPPIAFTLGAGELIRGWDEGVVGMKVGGRRRLVIPPGMAYGAGGRGPIPPMSTLVFVVDLVEIAR